MSNFYFVLLHSFFCATVMNSGMSIFYRDLHYPIMLIQKGIKKYHIYMYVCMYAYSVYIYIYMFVGCVVLVINKSTTKQNNIRHST